MGDRSQDLRPQLDGLLTVGSEVFWEYANPDQSDDAGHGVIGAINENDFDIVDSAGKSLGGFRFSDLGAVCNDEHQRTATFLTKDGAVDISFE